LVRTLLSEMPRDPTWRIGCEFPEAGQFVLPHLSVGSRGPAPKLSLHSIFNYILRQLYLGGQWKELPIEKDGEGRPEVHCTRIYSAWRRWVGNGCMAAIFVASMLKLHRNGLLDTGVIHADGTTTGLSRDWGSGCDGP
jgi:hypothetical protein